MKRKITLLAMILASINAIAILPPSCATPIIIQQPSNNSTCAGQNVFFSIIANGNTLTYQWQVNQGLGAGFTDLSNGIVYNAVTSNILTVSSIPLPFNGYQYRCVITDSCSNIATTNAATLFISLPPIVTANSATIVSGGTAILTAAGATSYVWHIGGMMGNPSNPISLSPTSTTTYTVTGTSNGCSSTTTTTVTVNLPGIVGATGSTGATGTTGATGFNGLIGATGVNGTNGIDGLAGVAGATGVTGATGADGALSAWGKGGTSGTNPATDFLGTTDATALSFRTNNVERIRILPSGSIGVGTATPVSIGKVFQVSSNDASGTSMFLENSVSGGKNWRMLSAATNNTGGAGSFMIVNHTDDSANPKLMITPAGNIGIGTATPNSIGKTLHIASTNTGGTSLFLENTKSWRMLSTGTANTGGGGNLLIVNHSDDAANPKFTISASGNVGVGTVAPSAKLDVNGNAKIANNLTVGGSVTFAGNKTISYAPASGNTPATLSFGSCPGCPPWQLPTPDPCYFINIPINNTVNQFTGILQSFLTGDGGNTGVLSMGFNGDNGIIELASTTVDNTTAPAALFINNSCGRDIYMCNETSGNVGIGTATPAAKLHVKTQGGTGILSEVDQNLSKAFTVGVTSGSTFTENFVIYGDGHVFARDIKVKLGSLAHPDYIFDQSYKLRTLAELEIFLIENHHLPSVPSTCEVTENKGINLGEMSEIQLQKIEELYLYIIEMNKKIIEQNKRIEALENNKN
ncbi:MAG: hypothetical protein V4511_01970 [Bacteroidota bacterium]